MEPWKKTLLIALTIVFFQSIGMSMLMPFLPLFIKELGVVSEKAQASWSGVIFGVSYLSLALMSPFWGSLGDRYGRKPLILRTTFGVACIALMMSWATNIYQLLALRILQGILGGVMPILIALVSIRLPKEKMGQGMGMLQAALLAGTIVGPFIGGALSDLMGFRNVLLVIASSTSLAGIITLFFIHEDKRLQGAASANVASNIRFVMSSSYLRMVAMTGFAIQFSLFVVEPIFPLYIVSLYRGGNASTMVGLIFSVAGFFTMLFVSYWGKRGDIKGHAHILMQCVLITAITYLPQALVSTAYQLLILRAMIGFGVAGIMPSTQSMIIKNTSDGQRGGVLGIMYSLNIMGQAIGPLIGGGLASIVGYRTPFVLTSLLLIGVFFYLKNYFKKSVHSG